MTRLLLLTMTTTLAGALPAIGTAQSSDDCLHEVQRDAVVDAAGARRLQIVARAGALDVEGIEGLTEVRVRGRACASAAEWLDEIQLAADRRGDDVRVEARMPERGDWGDGYARLYLIIEVPAGLAADIEDTSGAMELRGLGPLTIDDDSGAITARDVRGPVSVRDGSGSIDLERIAGNVEIEDGSGSLELRDIDGTVELTDGSGSITVREVTGSVTVRRDGSGSIEVTDVEGDFIVENDGSGGVHYDNVGGAVRAPGDRSRIL